MESEEEPKKEERLSDTIGFTADEDYVHEHEKDHESELKLDESTVSYNVSEYNETPQERIVSKEENLGEDTTQNETGGQEEHSTLGQEVYGEDNTDIDQLQEQTATSPEHPEPNTEEPKVDINEEETADKYEEQASAEEVEDDDDDFGSFDEASFEEFQGSEPTEHHQSVVFDSAVMEDAVLFRERLDDILDSVLPRKIHEASNQMSDSQLLTDGGRERLNTFSTLPRLNPPNWTRLKMRHGLLVSLGVPINLDELGTTQVSSFNKPSPRRRSTTEEDIKWGDFTIPEFESLNISDNRRNELMALTLSILSKIEDNNLNNTTEQFLLQCSEEVVNEKYREMQENYAQLVELSSVWQAQIQELRNSQEMFESVVQNMVGYRQKLQRNEILEGLSKSKRGKRVF